MDDTHERPPADTLTRATAPETSATSAAPRRPPYQRALEVRRNHALLAGGLGTATVFLPAADVFAIAAIWSSMLLRIAEVYGHAVDASYAKKFALSVAKGTLLYYAGSRLLTSLLGWTGIGAPAAIAANAALNYGYTHFLGSFLIAQFRRPNLDWGSLAGNAVLCMLSLAPDEVKDLAVQQGALADEGAPTTAPPLDLADPDRHPVFSRFVESRNPIKT